MSEPEPSAPSKLTGKDRQELDKWAIGKSAAELTGSLRVFDNIGKKAYVLETLVAAAKEREEAVAEVEKWRVTRDCLIPILQAEEVATNVLLLQTTVPSSTISWRTR